MGTRSWLRNAAIGILGLTMSAGAAFAHGDKHEGYRFEERGRDNGRIHRIDWREHRRDSRWDRREHKRERRMLRREHRSELRKHRREHWYSRNERRHDRYARRYDRRPSGWDHGRKQGWRGNHLPPGQEKKLGSRFGRGDRGWSKS